jgi:hypothetical protein
LLNPHVPVSTADETEDIEVLEGTSNFHFQHRKSRTYPIESLRMIVDAPWYVPNTVIRRDLQTPTVKEEIRRYSSQYSARFSVHPNAPVVNLMAQPD